MLSNHLLSCHKKLKSTGFVNDKLIQNKRQASLLRLLTRAKFSRKYLDYLTVKIKDVNVANIFSWATTIVSKKLKTLCLKHCFYFVNFNLIRVIIQPTCQEEHFGKTELGKTRLLDQVKAHWQNVRQPYYPKLKKWNIRKCLILPQLKIWPNVYNLL